MSKGELYTFVTNKSAKGKKKSIVACISATKAEEITNVLLKLPAKDRMKVKEITLEMATNMSLAAAKSFPLATQVIARFHVIRYCGDLGLGWCLIFYLKYILFSLRNEPKKP